MSYEIPELKTRERRTLTLEASGLAKAHNWPHSFQELVKGSWQRAVYEHAKGRETRLTNQVVQLQHGQRLSIIAFSHGPFYCVRLPSVTCHLYFGGKEPCRV